MLPKIRSELDFARADAACAGLRSALRLDDGELRQLVLRLPPVLSLSVVLACRLLSGGGSGGGLPTDPARYGAHRV